MNHNANTAGGKSVTVEYSREDGSKVQCSYLHLSDIAVKVGDVVNASQKLGVSGNTGTRTTGEHLHFGVKSVSADGSKSPRASRPPSTAGIFWDRTHKNSAIHKAGATQGFCGPERISA